MQLTMFDQVVDYDKDKNKNRYAVVVRNAAAAAAAGLPVNAVKGGQGEAGRHALLLMDQYLLTAPVSTLLSPCTPMHSYRHALSHASYPMHPIPCTPVAMQTSMPPPMKLRCGCHAWTCT